MHSLTILSHSLEMYIPQFWLPTARLLPVEIFRLSDYTVTIVTM